MAYSNGKISAPVSIYDIQRVLGVSLTDLGSLCTSDKINMWSKFKPVRSDIGSLIDTTTYLSGTTWNESLSSQWWRDTLDLFTHNCKYGIYAQTGTSLAAIFGHYTNNRVWQYIMPSGGIRPYRQLDFLQYNHKAPHPLGSISAPSSLILTSAADGGWSINVAMMKNQDDSEPITQRDWVTPEDILTTLWGACYFGFALIDSNGVVKIWVTGNRYYGMGTNGGRLAADSTYTIMPFYTNTELPQDESSGNLNPGPASIPGGTVFAMIPNVQCPQLVIPNGSVTHDDARFSVRAVLQNGRVQVTAVVDARPMTVTGGTVTFNGGTYNQIIIYVCKAGTIVGTGRPASTDILAQETFYTQASPLRVNSGNYATIGGSSRSYGISADKCRIYVYASANGSALDNTLVARASGDAMVSEGTIIPT